MRDLLLGRPVGDLDLVVDADAVDFGRRLAARIGATRKEHPRFSTAALALPGGERLDVAATRTETYRHPGALPEVATGVAIEDDLARRDFAINAMALELVPRRWLIDPFDGAADLARSRIRALHDRSFVDDPTRAFRAVRYANRLGFRIESGTRRSILAAVEAGALSRVSGDRIRRELALIFAEPGRGGAIAAIRALGLGAAIDPALAAPVAATARARRTEELSGESAEPTTWVCYLLAWMFEATESEAARICDRLGFAGANARMVRGWPDVVRRLEQGLAGRPRSEVNRLARGLSPDELVAAAACLPAADRRALLVVGEGSARVRLAIRGADLRAAGVPAGPAIGRALARTLAAREDGRIGAGEELAFALRAAIEASAP